MLKNHIKVFSLISILLVVTGFVLMFSSVSIGTFMGDSWRLEQNGKNFDRSEYNIVLKTYINNFVIVGSILLSTGLLLAILTYFVPLYLRRNKGR